MRLTSCVVCFLLVGYYAVLAQVSNDTTEYIHSCHNCELGASCITIGTDNNVKTEQWCTDRCNDTVGCTMSVYQPTVNQGYCVTSDCSDVSISHGSFVHRKTNTSDCPSFTLKQISGTTATCAGFDPDVGVATLDTCVSKCLDTEGCRGVTFDDNLNTCDYHNCSYALVGAFIPDFTFIQRICKFSCTRSYLQTCLNCDLGPQCQYRISDDTNYKSAYHCNNTCMNTDGCVMSTFRPMSNTGLCMRSACTEVLVRHGSTAIRQSCSDDCPTFKLDQTAGMTANCIGYTFADDANYNVTIEFCVAKCLDTDGCRGVTYNSTQMGCQYHNCSDTVPAYSQDITFVGRNCTAPCERQHWQTCLNCNFGPACQYRLGSDTNVKTTDTCNTTCSNDDHCLAVTYNPTSYEGTCITSACSELSVSVNYKIKTFRRSCADDCSIFKLKQSIGATANCSGYTFDEDAKYDVTSEYCVAKCLDTLGCRAVTYNATGMSCQYHNCHDEIPAVSDDITLTKRLCTTPACTKQYWQTCLNCEIGLECQKQLASSTNVQRSQYCHDSCQSTPQCVLATFRPWSYEGLCLYSACSEVRIEYGVTAFRYSCASDCPSFKLERISGTTANCSGYTFDEDEGFELTQDYCVAKCLDTDECRGVTFNSTDRTCLYHNCSSEISGAGMLQDIVFTKRICTNPCVRPYMQTCVNCGVGPYCQKRLQYINEQSTPTMCNDTCHLDNRCHQAVYNPSYDTNGICNTYNCTEVSVNPAMKSFRYSCASDCPEYKLTLMPNNTGNMSCIIGEPIMLLSDYHDCLEICLDTDLCRAATYYEAYDECVLYSCRDSTYVGASYSTVHIDRDCNLQSCNRTYVQTCRGCTRGALCPETTVEHVSEIALDYNCVNNSVWSNNENVFIARYYPSYTRCYYYSCIDVKPGFYSNTIYRRSCAGDCLEYKLKEHDDTMCMTNILDVTDPYDVITDVDFCISQCLDMTGCRGITYDETFKRCHFTGPCSEFDIQPMAGYIFIERICITEVDPRQNTQICHNCGSGSDCQQRFDFISGVYLDYACNGTCENKTDCIQMTYGSSDNCNYIQCSQVEQAIGGTVHRMTNTTSCLEFELFTFKNYTGNCSTMGKIEDATGPWHCMDICLEIEDCRGITYYDGNETCDYYGECDSMVESEETVFVQRVCWNATTRECERQYPQMCINCAKGPNCQTGWSNSNNFYKPKDIDTSVLVHPDMEQIWWDPHNNGVQRVQCSQVQMTVGSTVWRKSCSSDCPNFEMFVHKNTLGSENCTVLGEKAGGLTLEYCIEICLDMDNCKGMTFDGNLSSCVFHDCTNYTYGEANTNFTFMRRECFDPNASCSPDVIQTCIGCNRGPDCQWFYETDDDNFYNSNCSDIRNLYNESSAVSYRRFESRCRALQCTQVNQAIGRIQFRESCNTECPKYEIFIQTKYQGTCDVIGFIEGGINREYCIEKCIDMPGCMGTTFNNTAERCDFHNGTDANSTTIGTSFTWKRCLGPDPPRPYLQTCVNCRLSALCQGSDIFTETPIWQACFTHFNQTLFPHMTTYDMATGRCQMTDCTFVEMDMNHMAFRRSPSAACSNYRIFKVPRHNGTCPEIGYDIGGVNIEYCLDKCLDMDDCRGISYTYSNTKCTYHNCTDHAAIAVGGGIQYWWDVFVERICIDDLATELEPVKPYDQICHNCFNEQCETEFSGPGKLANQSSIQIYTQCDTSCQHCDNVQYVAETETCTQRQCDRPTPWAKETNRGAKILRKSQDPDCREFELVKYFRHKPDCDPYDYDDGLASANDTDWCTRKCLDTPGCRAVAWNWWYRNCTYYTCTNITFHFMTHELIVRQCIEGCDNTTLQTCANCGVGPNCPTVFGPVLQGVTESFCDSKCAMDDICTGTDTTNSTCAQYNCSEPGQLYQSTFHRKTCNTYDCDKYEMYMISGSYGTCDQVLSVQYDIESPHICFERCLDTTGCFAVTHYFDYANTWPPSGFCKYHTCDCSVPGHYGISSWTSWLDDGNTTYLPTFMWIYCLNDTQNATELTIPTTATYTTQSTYDCTGNVTTNSTGNATFCSVPVIDNFYPKASDNFTCFPPPTVSTTPSTTTPSTTTPLGTTTPPDPGAIYIMPCQCSTGLFGNMTTDQIIAFLLQNLTIDAEDTAKEHRKYSSVYDGRPSSQAIGGVGAALMAGVSGSIIILDITNLIKAINKLSRKALKAMKKKKSEALKRAESIRRMSVSLVEDAESSPVDMSPAGPTVETIPEAIETINENTETMENAQGPFEDDMENIEDTLENIEDTIENIEDTIETTDATEATTEDTQAE